MRAVAISVVPNGIFRQGHVLGRPEEAAAILSDILHQYRRGTPVWRYQERRWYYAAKKLLKTGRRKGVQSAAAPSAG